MAYSTDLWIGVQNFPALPRGRLWRFAALVVGAPSCSIFSEVLFLKPHVAIIKSDVAKTTHPTMGASVSATAIATVPLLTRAPFFLCALLLRRLLQLLRSPF
jgi:hypothetical protein